MLDDNDGCDDEDDNGDDDNDSGDDDDDGCDDDDDSDDGDDDGCHLPLWQLASHVAHTPLPCVSSTITNLLYRQPSFTYTITNLLYTVSVQPSLLYSIWAASPLSLTYCTANPPIQARICESAIHSIQPRQGSETHFGWPNIQKTPAHHK